MKILGLFLILLALSVQADIYRSVDKDGNIIFTDEPQGDAEKIELPPAMIYSPESIPTTTAELADEEVEDAPVNYQLKIVSPSDNEAIWSNNGNVTISVMVEPALNSDKGEQLSINLAGETQLLSTGTSSAQFENIPRGTHTATATVVDMNGVSIGQSTSVTFHIHRASVN